MSRNTRKGSKIVVSDAELAEEHERTLTTSSGVQHVGLGIPRMEDDQERDNDICQPVEGILPEGEDNNNNSNDMDSVQVATMSAEAENVLARLQSSLENRSVPKWSEMRKDKWEIFKAEYLHYVSVGGTVRIQKCIQPTVVKLLTFILKSDIMVGWERATYREVIRSVDLHYSADDEVVMMKLMEGLYMYPKYTVDNLAGFFAKFDKKLESVDVTGLMSEEVKIQTWLKCLRDLNCFQEKIRIETSKLREKTLMNVIQICFDEMASIEKGCEKVKYYQVNSNHNTNEVKPSYRNKRDNQQATRQENNKADVADVSKDETVNKESKKTRKRLICFNCDGNHFLRQCDKEIDRERVQKKMDEYKKKKNDVNPVRMIQGEHKEGIANKVRVQVVNTKLMGIALIDTGANVGCISEEMARKLEANGSETFEGECRLAMADGSRVNVNRYMEVVLTTVGAQVTMFKLKCWIMQIATDFILDVTTAQQIGMVKLHGEILGEETNVNKYVLNICMWPDEVRERETEVIEEEVNQVTVGNKDSHSDDETESSFRNVVSERVSDCIIHEQVVEMLYEHREIFDGNLNTAAKVEPFKIEMEPGNYEINHAPRPLSSAMEIIVREEIDKLLAMGVIQESTSPVVSPVVMVKKSDGNYRMCIDYRELNLHTIPMRYPVRNTRTVLDRILGSKFFATLDLEKGYHQVPMDVESIKYTAFTVPWGVYEYVRLPFGVRNGPARFQLMMDKVFGSMLYYGVEVFVDDLLVHGRTTEEFLERLQKVLSLLQQYKLKVKISKSRFAYNDVTYIGYKIDAEGFEITDKHRDAIQQLGKPTSHKQVRCMNGLLNYFKMFIPKFSILCQPLFKLAASSDEFVWNHECAEALRKLKEILCKVNKLYYVDPDKMLYLQTDASNSGVGGALYQLKNEVEKPVADEDGLVRYADIESAGKQYVVFLSMGFNGIQRKWSTIEQELFAAYFCILQCERYLMGVPFVLETDHRNLRWLEQSVVPKLVRWRLRLAEFDFKVRFIPGKDNIIADALSRIPVIAAISVTTDSEESMDELVNQNRYLEIIKRVHGNGVGHKGVMATVKVLNDIGIQWTTMMQDVKNFIKNCVICQKLAKQEGVSHKTIYHIEATQPFQKVCIDTIGPLPEDNNKCKHIIVIIDVFTRYVELFGCRSTTAIEAADCLVKVFGRYGLPESIVSDQGTQYVNAVIAELLKLCGVKHLKSVPYHHQGNGMVERVNFEVMKHLRYIIYDEDVKKKWSKYLPNVQYIINTSVHVGIGVCPMSLVYGSSIMSHRGIIREFVKPREVVTTDYITELDGRLQHCNNVTCKYQAEYKVRRDRAVSMKEVGYMRGDKVLIKCHGYTSKLEPRWEGPFIVDQVRRTTLVVTHVNKATYKEVDVGDVKLFYNDLAQSCESDEAIAARDKDMYIVQEIINHIGDLKKPKKCSYVVKWQGYEGSTVEPYAGLRNNSVLHDYLAKNKK